ncbi:hypothetical protein CPB85DRAFT_1286205 [Mucidula mucida]|nr:hypothetical protein CPB85DRAFT_1286205 [Mucidula mucida]
MSPPRTVLTVCLGLCLVASSDSTQNTLVSSGAVHDQSFPIGPHYPSVGNYENPNDAYGYAVQPQRANVRPFQSAPVVGTASAFFQPAPRRTESQLTNLFPQSFPNSQPEGSLNSYPPSPYSWRPSQPSIGSPASNSDYIQHEIRGSDVYLPVSSLGVYDHGLIAVGMGIFDGVPQRSDQVSHEDALSERLPSADIPQAASPHGLDTAPIRRRRGRDELAIARRRKAPGQFACSHCGTATFTTKAAREKHIESLHLNTVYRCGIDGCPKAYAHQASLDRHRRDTHDTSKKRHGGAVD